MISTPKRKNDDFEAPLEGNLFIFKHFFENHQRQSQNGKILLPKHKSQPSCSHYMGVTILSCKAQ
jgi:hypothetical protein